MVLILLNEALPTPVEKRPGVRPLCNVVRPSMAWEMFFGKQRVVSHDGYMTSWLVV